MKAKCYRYMAIACAATLLMVAAACSTTSALPEGEQLFTGLKKISYTGYEPSDYATATQTEIESVLASAPNGALFGSSYYRTPFQWKLWVWNAFSQSESGVAKWLVKAFGSKPKLMSEVNPSLRASVAETQLKKFGYFNGRVTFEEVTGKHPKKAKVAYHVDMGHLWTMDSIAYVGFPSTADSLIHATRAEAVIHNGSPFSVSALERERQRVGSLLRNNGYYYYQPGYASYLADTVNIPGKAMVRLQLADSIDEAVVRQWHIGRISFNLKREFTDSLRDSVRRRNYTVRYNGRRPPIRTGALLRDLKLRAKQLYSYSDEQWSMANLQNTGLFSYNSMKATPRDKDTIDLAFDLVLDKPYDFYVEANAKGKTTGRMGPELVMGLTKRNAFRGGERLDFNLHGLYEWQTGHQSEGSSSGVKSYEYGGDVSLTFPRLLTPMSLLRRSSDRNSRRRSRRLYAYSTPTTTIKASANVLNRASYFKRHVISGELTYSFQPSASSRHTFSPLILSYEYMQRQTDAFLELLADNPYLSVSMRDQFVPKMSYTYAFTSPSTYRNPIIWETTVSEAGNVLAAGYAVAGKSWGEADKKLFQNPFAQFLKVQTDFVKHWRLSETSVLVGHAGAGVIYSYGNARQAPYSEQFYVGGANSVRAFNVRSIGPGRYRPSSSRLSYIEQTGDLKLVANLEYRPRLFGSLYGALFLDAGNVWALRGEDSRDGAKFEAKSFLRQMAVGTGVGLRYDVGLFVIRVDWGLGLHVPYDTGKSGFYNVSSFKDGQCLHLAVGYPF